MIIGLTGGIGSGKSLAASFLCECGAFVVNADDIGREVVRPGTQCNLELQSAFGKEFFTEEGELKRKKLGELVFFNHSALEKLNKITHRAIFEEINCKLDSSTEEIKVVEAAIIFESDWTDFFDEIWLITAETYEREQRIATRDKLTKEQIQARISSQLPEDEKIKLAHVIIENNGNIESMRKKIIEEYEKALVKSKDKRKILAFGRDT